MPANCEELLDLLWQISWQAGAIAILVLLLQHTLGLALPHRWRHALWTLVLLRLLLPALPHNRFSLFSIESKFATAVAPAPIATPLPSLTTTQNWFVGSSKPDLPASSNQPILPAAPKTPIWQLPISWIVGWLWIAVALLAFRIVMNLRFHRRLARENEPASPRLIALLDQARSQTGLRRQPMLCLTNLIDTPAVAGLFRSRILLPVKLPEQLTDEELSLVLLHELTHIACFDVAIDWLWTVVQSLHWFNPVLWIITPIRRNDRELARDEMVLSLAGKSQAPRYGQLLIDLAQPAHLPMFCPGLIGMLTDKKRLQRRIKMIAKFEDHRWYATIGGLALLIAAGGCLLTAPAKPENKTPAANLVTATTQPGVETITITNEDGEPPDEPLSEKDRETNAKLDQHIAGQVSFTAKHLADVIDDLSNKTGTHIHVDWAALGRAGINKDSQATARLVDIKFAKALELIFKSVEPEDSRLGYSVDDGTITISTRKELDKNVVTRRYDINDLIFIAPDYNSSPELSKLNASQASSAPSDKGQSGLFTNALKDSVPPAQDRASRIDDIKKYIIDNVETASWKDNGGDIGSIASSPLRAVLLITQTPRAHRKVQTVLDSLRASRAVQISIESRNISLTDTLEAKLPENLRNRLASVRNAGRYRRDQFLTDAEVTQLLQAVQSEKISTSLTAPRLTLFSGQTACLVVATQQAYVGGMTKIPATTTQPARYEPVTKTATATGVVLKVTSCASPDGATAFVDLHDQIARMTELLNERYGTDPAAGKIQRPVIVTFKVDAACGVPSQMALLLGGTRQVDAGDMRFNADSPDKPANDAAIEKIRADEHQHTYLLIKPTVLKQK